MWREILGLDKKPNSLVELLVPKRSFSDVVLPDETRQQLYEALTQIEKHRLIFTQWGLGERHPTGMGLAFNFAGPPGTGKTICAEAITYTLGRKLLRVRYAELESCWAGETGKNIRAVFREAKAQEAVLFFDEADSVAARRFSNVQIGYEREANQAVNILLKELEEHEGVVIFATNMAANFDPAFERRIRTHILFKVPGVSEREKIWNVQVHPEKTPLADDVSFRELSERFEITGGDIRNAVLKAAQMAAAEEGADERKRIHQRHFIAATEQVLQNKSVMQQNALNPFQALLPWQEAVEATEQRIGQVEDELQVCRTELELLGDGETALGTRIEALVARVEELDGRGAELTSALERLSESQQTALAHWEGEQKSGLAQLNDRLQAYEARLAQVTLIGWPKAVTAAVGAAVLLLAALGGHFVWR